MLQGNGREAVNRSGLEAQNWESRSFWSDTTSAAILVGPIPEWVDAQCLNVYPCTSIALIRCSAFAVEKGGHDDRRIQERIRFGHGTVRVRVNHTHPATADYDLAASFAFARSHCRESANSEPVGGMPSLTPP